MPQVASGAGLRLGQGTNHIDAVRVDFDRLGTTPPLVATSLHGVTSVIAFVCCQTRKLPLECFGCQVSQFGILSSTTESGAKSSTAACLFGFKKTN